MQKLDLIRIRAYILISWENKSLFKKKEISILDMSTMIAAHTCDTSNISPHTVHIH